MRFFVGVMLFSSVTVHAQCPITSSHQNVNLYDGSLGVSVPFVKTHAKHAVGLTGGSGATCSGTFLPGNRVLTADHCLGSNISNLKVTFNYQLNQSGVLEVQENFPVLHVIERNLEGYDYAILQIGSNANGVNAADKYPVARLSGYINSQQGGIFTSIGHSGGQPKNIDTGMYHTYKDRGWMELTGLETYGGASGGGILDGGGYLTSLALAVGCGDNTLGVLTGGHSVRELVRISPTLKSIYSTYSVDWLNRHTNNFNNGIQWSNIGSNNWVLTQNASGNRYAGFHVNTTTGVTTVKRAILATHPITIHPSGSKKVNFYASVGGSVSPTELSVYVRHGDNRTFLWTKYHSPTSNWLNSTHNVELDLSAYTGVVKLEFEAVAYASQSSSQRSTITIDNVILPDFSPVLAAIVDKNNFITSAWAGASGAGLHTEYGSLQSGMYLPGWHSAHWQFKVIDGQYVKITNRHNEPQSLHMENGSLAVGAAPDGWHSAQWILEPAPGYSVATMKAYRIKNRHTNMYLNMEGMLLQASSVPENYWSSYWNIVNI